MKPITADVFHNIRMDKTLYESAIEAPVILQQYQSKLLDQQNAFTYGIQTLCASLIKETADLQTTALADHCKLMVIKVKIPSSGKLWNTRKLLKK